MQVQGCLGYGTTQHRGQATRNSGGRSEYSMSFLAPLNHKEGIRSLHHKIQRHGDWRRGRKGRGGREGGRDFSRLSACRPACLPPCAVGEQGLKHSFLHGRAFPIVVCFVVQWNSCRGFTASPRQQAGQMKPAARGEEGIEGGGVGGGVLPSLIPSKRKGVGI